MKSTTATRPASPSRLRAAAPLALVVLVAIAAHARSLGADFVYDDRAIVSSDERIAMPSRWGELLTKSYWGQFSPDRLYRPVTLLSFALPRLVLGPSPAAAHAVNVALHAAVAALLLGAARRLRPDRPGAGLAAALVFACHPAISEAVAEIVGRADLLAALFSLLAVRAALRGAAVGPALAAALAFLSKESAIGLALAVPLAAGQRSGGAGFDRRAALRASIPLAVALGVALALRTAVLASDPPPPVLPGFAVENPIGVAPLGARVATALHVLGRYAVLLAFPVRLRSDASYAEIHILDSPLDPLALLGAALLAALAFGAFRWTARRSPLAVGALLALGPIAIVSNLLFSIGTIYGERLLYLPAIGLALLAPAAPRVPAAAARPAIAAIVILHSARTLAREGIYASEDAFFRAMIEDSPRSAKAWNTLAARLLADGRADEAGRAVAAALGIHPDFPEAIAQRGQIAVAAKDWARAEADFRLAISKQPAFGLARLALAQILKDSNRLDEAAREFSEAARLLPRFPEPDYGLGAVRLAQRRDDEALAAFDAALAKRPGFGYARFGRGVVAHRRGDRALAEAEFRAARAASPELAPQIDAFLERP